MDYSEIGQAFLCTLITIENTHSKPKSRFLSQMTSLLCLLQLTATERTIMRS